MTQRNPKTRATRRRRTMAARVAGFVSRLAWSARLPRSYSKNITPGKGGCAKHYAGPKVVINSHADCIRVWKGWQTYHMDGHGWADIAYTGGYCQHGYAFAGRGFRVRTAANGTNDGNQRFYAFCWIGGEDQEPTPEALNALEWWIKEARADGDAGEAVVNHSDLNSTSCPGKYLKAWKMPAASAPDPNIKPPRRPDMFVAKYGRTAFRLVTGDRYILISQRLAEQLAAQGVPSVGVTAEDEKHLWGQLFSEGVPGPYPTTEGEE
jgi:hypothetical protein